MDRIDTTDRDSAGEVLGRTFPGIRIDDDPDGRPFRLRYARVDRGTLTRTVLDVRGRLRAPGDYPDHIAVGRRRGGRVDIRYRDDGLDTARPYLRPPGRSTADFEDSGVELLIVDRAAFAARAARHLEGSGRELQAPAIGRSSPATEAGARLWDATADVLATAFEGDAGVACGVLEELAVTALLAAFPMTVEQGRPERSGALPKVIRRAAEFMQEHLGEQITIVDVADAAGVSVRTLQAGFRQRLGATPHEHLRQLRLQAARRSLQDGDPGRTSVAEVASRSGFVHLSRFAASYRRVYGENPSETLRR